MYPLLFIDDSTGQGQEEEGYYYEEEEENFNHISNQGKLILANPMLQANPCNTSDPNYPWSSKLHLEDYTTYPVPVFTASLAFISLSELTT